MGGRGAAVSLVGENIARATAAGIRAARIAPLVHCDPAQRVTIRWKIVLNGSPAAQQLRNELEARWRLADAGLPARKDT